MKIIHGNAYTISEMTLAKYLDITEPKEYESIKNQGVGDESFVVRRAFEGFEAPADGIALFEVRRKIRAYVERYMAEMKVERCQIGKMEFSEPVDDGNGDFYISVDVEYENPKSFSQVLVKTFIISKH